MCYIHIHVLLGRKKGNPPRSGRPTKISTWNIAQNVAQFGFYFSPTPNVSSFFCHFFDFSDQQAVYFENHNVRKQTSTYGFFEHKLNLFFMSVFVSVPPFSMVHVVPKPHLLRRLPKTSTSGPSGWSFRQVFPGSGNSHWRATGGCHGAADRHGRPAAARNGWATPKSLCPEDTISSSERQSTMHTNLNLLLWQGFQNEDGWWLKVRKRGKELNRSSVFLNLHVLFFFAAPYYWGLSLIPLQQGGHNRTFLRFLCVFLF